jgi:CRISPR-associated protein Cmr2
LPADWDLLTIAFLHDPPDKALDIRGHERRAARYLQAALGRPADVFLIKQDAGLADRLAAMAERLPMPTAGPAGERAVSASDRRLRIHHPLGGGSREIIVPDLDEAKVEAEIKNIVAGIDPMQSRHLALWRLLPERLAVLDPAYADLPADTRVPDHTIWHHADTAAALTAADTGAVAAFLSFALAPVQTFIAAARSLHDLWSGSLILSWVTFRALLPIVEEAGPSALVFPYLRGNPMLDRWLRSQPGLADKIPNPSEEACGTPSLPNRFLALVPAGPDAGDALALARRCEEAARDAWRELAEKVRHRIARYVQDFAGWDALWQTQIDEFWEIRCAVLPYRAIPDDRLAAFNGANSFAEAWPEAQRIRALGQRIPESERPGYAQDCGSLAGHSGSCSPRARSPAFHPARAEESDRASPSAAEMRATGDSRADGAGGFRREPKILGSAVRCRQPGCPPPHSREFFRSGLDKASRAVSTSRDRAGGRAPSPLPRHGDRRHPPLARNRRTGGRHR